MLLRALEAHGALESMNGTIAVGWLVVATPDTFDLRQMIKTARTLDPGIEAVVRTHDEEEVTLLEREGAGKIFLGEDQLAKGMIRHVLERYGKAVL